MRSVRTAIFRSIVAGFSLFGCAASPAGILPGAGGPTQDELPGEGVADDDVDGTEDAVVDDDDLDEDDQADDDAVVPPLPSKDAGADARIVDAASADAATSSTRGPDAGTSADASAPEPKLDATVADARTPTPVDARTPTPVDAAASIGKDAATSASCAPGTYRGTFSGDITSVLSRARITATITMTLAATGATLRIESGKMEGRDADGNAITAQVAGALNCATRRLENAVLREGVYSVREGLLDSIRFDGTLAGALSVTAPATIAGSWTLRSALGTRDGSGTFSAAQ